MLFQDMLKTWYTNASTDYSIPVIQLERKISQINELVEDKIKSRFDEFGVTVSGL